MFLHLANRAGMICLTSIHYKNYQLSGDLDRVLKQRRSKQEFVEEMVNF